MALADPFGAGVRAREAMPTVPRSVRATDWATVNAPSLWLVPALTPRA